MTYGSHFVLLWQLQSLGPKSDTVNYVVPLLQRPISYAGKMGPSICSLGDSRRLKINNEIEKSFVLSLLFLVCLMPITAAMNENFSLAQYPLIHPFIHNLAHPPSCIYSSLF
jgi:hypothetical protein